jgi:uncharacterized protein (DUF4415 family)
MIPRSRGTLCFLNAPRNRDHALDADLLHWFRRQPGYQTRINAILRAYMQAHESG